MSRYDEDEIHDDDQPISAHDHEHEQQRKLMAGVSGWLVSLAAHGLIAMVLTTMVIFQELEQERAPIQPVVLEPPEEQEQEEIVEQEFEEVQVQVQAEAIQEQEMEEIELPQETDLGVEEDVGDFDVMMGNQGAGDDLGDLNADGGFMNSAIGVGGGSGAFMNRQGGNKKRALGRHGGNRDSEASVEAALRWFRRHQSPNGMWDADGYQDNCNDGMKCEPGKGNDEKVDVAATAYALLCYLGAGYDHMTPNNYRSVVGKGLDWLQQQGRQSHGGIQFSSNIYATSIATMAVAEAYAMTQDRKLRRLTEDAVKYLLSQQNPDPTQKGGVLGWNYNPTPYRHDMSVSGWAIMALKSAAAAGIDVGQGMRGGLRATRMGWEIVNADKLAKGDLSRTDTSGFPYSFNPAGAYKDDETTPVNEQLSGTPGFSGDSRTFIGAVCAVFLGVKANDIMLETMMNHIMQKHVPKEYPCNTYSLYYSTLALFQAGGDRWLGWNRQVRDMLVEAQAGSDQGCRAGSWAFTEHDFHGADLAARLFSTAYVCLSLEVYYRYVPLH